MGSRASSSELLLLAVSPPPAALYPIAQSQVSGGGSSTLPGNLDLSTRPDTYSPPAMHPPLHKPSTEAGTSRARSSRARRATPVAGRSGKELRLSFRADLPVLLLNSLPRRYRRARELSRSVEEVDRWLQHGEDRCQRLPAQRGASPGLAPRGTRLRADSSPRQPSPIQLARRSCQSSSGRRAREEGCPGRQDCRHS